MYVGYELMKNDMITLGYPETTRERALWELEGRKENTIKIGGKWRNPIVLGPAGNLVLMGAYYRMGQQDSVSPSMGMYEGIKAAGLGGLDAFKEQTFLTGINNFVKAFDDPMRFGPAYAASLGSSLVPTLVSDVGRSLDPLDRRSENVMERIQSRIPIAREGLEPRVDVLGKSVESAGNPIEIMLDPTRPAPDVSTKVTKELRRLTDAGFPITPTKLGGTKKGYAVLSQEENTELWKKVGSLVNSKLSALMSDPRYINASDEERAKIVEKFIDKARIDGRAAMVIELTDGLSGASLTAKLSELKAGKLLNSDVFRRYQELR